MRKGFGFSAGKGMEREREREPESQVQNVFIRRVENFVCSIELYS